METRSTDKVPPVQLPFSKFKAKLTQLDPHSEASAMRSEPADEVAMIKKLNTQAQKLEQSGMFWQEKVSWNPNQISIVSRSSDFSAKVETRERRRAQANGGE